MGTAAKKPDINKTMKLKNIIAALKDQGPFTRFCRNVWKGHVFGLFSKRSHENEGGKPKVMYNTKASAIKAAASLAKKRGAYFSNYKCMRCDGFHIGKNRDNKIVQGSSATGKWQSDKSAFAADRVAIVEDFQQIVKDFRNL